jgi:imidazolonepropionase-like amidohydrolase
MAAVKRFAELGGTVLTGEDAGFIYQVYGFCFLRELEMQEEAGFHPLQVIEHATGNGAKVLGQADRLGRVRPGYVADLLVVNGNPLENLRVLYPTGTDSYRDGKVVHGGGIEWTIKDGRTYHVPVLVDEARKLVAEARAKRK